jgi:CheY-like chemotaxis protein
VREAAEGDGDGPVTVNAALVLIAEDEAAIAEALAMIVEEAGYRPLLAAHGRRALELARERCPALLITDLMMPQLDGAELIAALRADTADGCAPIPVILTTAAPLPPAGQPAVDAYLRKPFTVAQVEALLHRFLVPRPGADAVGPRWRLEAPHAQDVADPRRGAALSTTQQRHAREAARGQARRSQRRPRVAV